MVLPQKRKGRQGAVQRIGVHGVRLDDGRFYPVTVSDDHGLSVAGDLGVLNQDLVDNSLVSIELEHHKVHEGTMYQAWIIDLELINDGALLMSTPEPIGYEVHFTFDAACGGNATLELLEGPTITGGAAITAWNMNRNFPDAPFQPIEKPALGGAPDTLSYTVLPGGKGPNAAGGSGGSRAGLEWVTNPAESYAVRLINKSGNTQPASIVVNFYFP